MGTAGHVIGERLLDQVMTIWILPEVRRRQARRSAPEPYPLAFAQVVFRVGAAPEIRLNEEVRGTALVRRADPASEIAVGDDVFLDDIAGVEHFELPDEDANAGHVTIVATPRGISISFDATYNKSHVRAHLDAAEEFFEAAQGALARGQFRPFAESAFAAAELLAKAELLPLPDSTILDSKTHGTVASKLHWWASTGNIDPTLAKLLTRLTELRDSSRYLRGGKQLVEGEADELFQQLIVLREHVRSHAPSQPGDFTPRTPRKVTMVAAQPIIKEIGRASCRERV